MTALSPRPSPEPCHRVLEQAAEWFALLLSGEATAADRRRWEDWLGASDEHKRAWGHIENLSRRFEPIKASPERQLAASAYRQASGSRARRRQALLGIAALAGAGLLGWTAWRHTPLPGLTQAWLADYRTDIGEIGEFALQDGTRVWLNAASAFSQDYQAGQRLLHLVRGEMLIDTGKDPRRRPFFVETAQGRLQALGTRFTVRLDGDERTTLAVYEGAVQVRTLAGQTALVEAGNQLRFGGEDVGDAKPADPAREAWRRGVLIARDMSLAEVVEELRRHYRGHLALAPEAARLRVFGSYPVNDPGQALAMLETVLPIRVRRPLPWWTSIEPKAEKR